MTERHASQVSREDLIFTVELALVKARRLWPRKRVPGDHDRLKPIAAAVVDHLELSRIRCIQLPPIEGHSTPEPCPVRNNGPDATNTDGVGEAPAPPGNAP